MKPDVIISLTSYPKRMPTICQLLEPLFHQSVPADRILLWLVREEFESAGMDLPEELLELEHTEPSFEIRWVPGENLRPNNKWLPAFTAYPDALIILIDDDLVYPCDLVRRLLDEHYRHPDAVIASRSHLVTLEDGDIAPYPTWEFEQQRFVDTPRYDLIATPGAGTLFPPHCLPEGAFDQEDIKRYAIVADDLWLMAWTLMANRPVVATDKPGLYYIDNTQDVALCNVNLQQGAHNDHLRELYARFPAFHDRLLAEVQQRMAADAAAHPAPAPQPPQPKRSLPVRLWHKCGRFYRFLRNI